MRALELKVPPVALWLAVGVAMWVTSLALPSLAVELPRREAISLAFAVFGVGFALAGVLAFRRARTTVDPTRPQATTAIVESGVYRISRNPMYVGFLLVLIGWAAWLAHVLAWLWLPFFVGYLTRFQIVPEERALRTHFGTAYERYMGSVRRWL